MELIIAILLIGLSIFQAANKARKQSPQQKEGDVVRDQDPWREIGRPTPHPREERAEHQYNPSAQVITPESDRPKPKIGRQKKKIVDESFVQKTEEVSVESHILDDFAPAKAILYAEIMTPKFREDN